MSMTLPRVRTSITSRASCSPRIIASCARRLFRGLWQSNARPSWNGPTATDSFSAMMCGTLLALAM